MPPRYGRPAAAKTSYGMNLGVLPREDADHPSGA
jgi:hypothetical protein